MILQLSHYRPSVHSQQFSLAHSPSATTLVVDKDGWAPHRGRGRKLGNLRTLALSLDSSAKVGSSRGRRDRLWQAILIQHMATILSPTLLGSQFWSLLCKWEWPLNSCHAIDSFHNNVGCGASLLNGKVVCLQGELHFTSFANWECKNTSSSTVAPKERVKVTGAK